MFYATNNILTTLESIYKFSEIVTDNTKYISNNHSNSFKVKISK